MSIQLEYVYGPGSLGLNSVEVFEKRGAKLSTLLTIYSKNRTPAGKHDAEDAAQCLCLLLANVIGPDDLTRLLAAQPAPTATEA
jgi:hypothetical protein